MEYKKTEKNKIKRGAAKASYDKEVIHSVLDATEICSIAFIHKGQAIVQPVNFGRSGEYIYLHGSLKNRMTNALIESGKVCLNVMLLDTMKISRSAFHHSVNYRSAVVFGSVKELKTDKEKLKGLKSIINHFIPNRWDHCRLPDQKELNATRVLEIRIETASAKIAGGPVNDTNKDKESNYWAGYIPVKTFYGNPVPAEDLKKDIEIPQHILDFYKKRKN
jgi:nitroimidazol reductase NimA-like FMN-containing flavoprotein (pyridoxamine 5'-phosphate oxidase superfamily)